MVLVGCVRDGCCVLGCRLAGSLWLGIDLLRRVCVLIVCVWLGVSGLLVWLIARVFGCVFAVGLCVCG